MDAARASKTALLVTLYRALDCELLRPPVLGDSFAARMLTAQEREEYEGALHELFCSAEPQLRGEPRREALHRGFLRSRISMPLVLARARFADDALAAALDQGVRQYVLVGAGLDTFVLRRPDLAKRVRTFEIDHPATQAEKRRRLAQQGLELPEAHHFAACDFEHEDVASALARMPFDRSQPTFFAWLGVTWYLTLPAIESTLRAIRRAAARSELVFDYRLESAIDPTQAPPEAQALRELLLRYGEPAITALAPAPLRDQLASLGFALVEDVGGEVLHARYLAERSDGIASGLFGRIVHARSTPA